jgi:hypothetical protein
MPYYVVQRKLAGVTPEELTGAGLRAKTCCAEMTDEGTPVRWIRSYFLPETEETHCYFEGDNADIIKEANERAQIPFASISEVMELSPESV